MIILNSRNELVEFLYGENSSEPDTLVGVVKIGGELLKEAMSDEYASDKKGYINEFFPHGDEGEEIVVDNDGNVIEDFLYY